MEKENAQLQNQLQSNAQRLDEVDRDTAELLDVLDQVSPYQLRYNTSI